MPPRTISYHPTSKTANLRKKDDRWHFDVRIKREDGSIFRRAGSAETEKEARLKRDQAFTEFNTDQGLGKETKRQKRADKTDCLASFAERAMSIIREDCALSTHDSYRHALRNHILPVLGSKSLEEIKASDVQTLLNKVATEKGVGVAAQARSAVVRVLQVAVRDNLIPGNPAKATAVSKRQRKQTRLEKAKAGEIGKRILSRREGDDLLAKVKGSVEYWPILLGLRFGLRSGEAMGLAWSQVDTNNGFIKIIQQAQYVKGEARHLTAPKSAAGVREVPIPSYLLAELSEAKAKAEGAGTEWVCVDESGRPFHPKHITRRIKTAVISAGLDGKNGKPVPTHHDFRSSWLTWLANEANGGQGMKPHELMKLAGHTDWQTTVSFYVRASDEDVRSAIDSLY